MSITRQSKGSNKTRANFYKLKATKMHLSALAAKAGIASKTIMSVRQIQLRLLFHLAEVISRKYPLSRCSSRTRWSKAFSKIRCLRRPLRVSLLPRMQQVSQSCSQQEAPLDPLSARNCNSRKFSRSSINIRKALEVHPARSRPMQS